MTILADFLRDNQGVVHRIFPDETGELHITNSQLDDLWGEPTYIMPSAGPIEYQTLKDSDGNTWYVYPTSANELVISTTAPTIGAGSWGEPVYGDKVIPVQSGSIIYELLKTVASTSMYVYPNTVGELIVTTTEP